MAVKVVTDSTSDLPPDMARELDITVVPLNVHFEDQVYKDGIDITPDDFYQRLVSTPKLPTTSQPSVGDFLQVYRELAEAGDEIVSVHISAKLSGTFNSAIQAREALGDGGRIHIIDTQQAAIALGLVAKEAAQMVQGGASCQEVVEGVERSLPHTHCFCLLDTLEYLQKGGRIGKAQAFLGSLLRIKPIITVREGEAHPLGRVRTRSQGLAKMEQMAREFASIKELCVAYSTSPEDAEALCQHLGELVPRDEIMVCRFGPVLGTYLGPGAVGMAVIAGH